MSSFSPPPLDRSLLAKVLGLLGSEQDGEALSAARTADRMVRASGHDWNFILANGTTVRNQSRERMIAPQEIMTTAGVLLPPYGQTWRASVWWLLNQRGVVRTEHDAWVLDFLAMRLARRGEDRPPLISAELAADVVRMAQEHLHKGEAA